jgi:hypothetical protein
MARGFFRLWVVLSVLLIAGTVVLLDGGKTLSLAFGQLPTQPTYPRPEEGHRDTSDELVALLQKAIDGKLTPTEDGVNGIASRAIASSLGARFLGAASCYLGFRSSPSRWGSRCDGLREVFGAQLSSPSTRLLPGPMLRSRPWLRRKSNEPGQQVSRHVLIESSRFRNDGAVAPPGIFCRGIEFRLCSQEERANA